MKKQLIIFAFAALIIASCKPIYDNTDNNLTQHPPPFNGPGVSRERVKAIATKYGLQDSIPSGCCPSNEFIPYPEEAYQYLSEEYFEEFFSSWVKHLKIHKHFLARRDKVSKLQTVQEYFAFVENDPNEYKGRIEEQGGINGYNAFKKDALAGKYHIYTGHPDVGSVITVPADGDKPGTIKGRLLKN